MMFAVKI